MTSITLDKFLNSVETGDILLYSTNIWYSKIIEYFQGSKFSHIGILLKDPVYINKKLKGLYVLESGYETTPDPVDGKYKFGVQIISLDNVIKTYQNSSTGIIYYRQLYCIRNQEFKNLIEKIYNEIQNKPYDINIWDWIKAYLKIDIGNEHKTNKFWCSALSAFIYNKMNFLKDVPCTIISPKNFSYYEDNITLKFINCEILPEKKNNYF